MAEVQEKDNTWLIVGICIASMILLVVMLKKDETKHLQSGVVAEQQKETFAKIDKRHTSNNSTSEQISGK
jgi:heme exporter protein D